MATARPTARHSHRLFAWAYGTLGGPTERGPVGRARRQLFAHASGDVLDLGAGTGLDVPALRRTNGSVHLVEPSGGPPGRV